MVSFAFLFLFFCAAPLPTVDLTVVNTETMAVDAKWSHDVYAALFYAFTCHSSFLHGDQLLLNCVDVLR